MGKICMWCAHHMPCASGRYRCGKTGESRNCLDPACGGYESSLRGFTPAEADRTVEVVIPVPVTEEYGDFGLHVFFYPSRCGAFDRAGLSETADLLENEATDMEGSPYRIGPGALRRYAERIRESIGKADAHEQP